MSSSESKHQMLSSVNDNNSASTDKTLSTDNTLSTSQQQQDEKPLFQDISADAVESDITEIESLCMSCKQNGSTRMLLTRIPFFKEVVLMSFECPHCHYRNNELQPTGRVQEQGCRYTLTVRDKQDLNRQVVRTDTASVYIPHLEFEIPANTQKGALTTVEGIVERSISGLQQDQAVRRRTEPDVAARLDRVIDQLRALTAVSTSAEPPAPWTLVISDPSGNSFIENPAAPNTDPNMTLHHYQRALEEDRMLGFVADDEGGQGEGESGQDKGESGQDKGESGQDKGESGQDKGEGEGEGRIGKDEVLMFNDNCSNCSAPLQTKMKLVDVPHFKSVIVMASQCSVCGHKSNEVKAGSGVEPQGVRLTLTLPGCGPGGSGEQAHGAQLSRDVIKSETCKVMIPELEFEHDTWVSGGKFTTVEGLLADIKAQLVEQNPFISGDSSQADIAGKLRHFADRVDQIISGEMTNVHLILDDPAGNTYIQSIVSGSGVDDHLAREVYSRSREQDDDLGITDMNTDPNPTTS